MPALKPVTIPEPEPTVATDGVPLVHVPPVGMELSVVVVATHSASVPAIALGAAVTVSVRSAKHPVDGIV